MRQQAGAGRRETLRLGLVTLILSSETHFLPFQLVEYVSKDEVELRWLPPECPPGPAQVSSPPHLRTSRIYSPSPTSHQGLTQQGVRAPEGRCPVHPNQTRFRPGKRTLQNRPRRLKARFQICAHVHNSAAHNRKKQSHSNEQINKRDWPVWRILCSRKQTWLVCCKYYVVINKCGSCVANTM